jgi:hypothetical protein
MRIEDMPNSGGLVQLGGGAQQSGSAPPSLPAPQLPKTALAPGVWKKRAASLVPDANALNDVMVDDWGWGQFRTGNADFTSRARADYSQALDEERSRNLAAIEAQLGPAPWRAQQGDSAGVGATGAAGPTGPTQGEEGAVPRGFVPRYYENRARAQQGLGPLQPAPTPAGFVPEYYQGGAAMPTGPVAPVSPLAPQPEGPIRRGTDEDPNAIFGMQQTAFGREAARAAAQPEGYYDMPMSTLGEAQAIRQGRPTIPLPPDKAALTPEQQAMDQRELANRARIDDLDAQIAAAAAPRSLPPLDMRLAPQAGVAPPSGREQMLRERGDANMANVLAQQQADRKQAAAVYQAQRTMRVPGKVFDRQAAEQQALADITDRDMQAARDAVAAGLPVPPQMPEAERNKAMRRAAISEYADQVRQGLAAAGRAQPDEARRLYPGAFVGDADPEGTNARNEPWDEVLERRRANRLARQQRRTGAALPTGPTLDPRASTPRPGTSAWASDRGAGRKAPW